MKDFHSRNLRQRRKDWDKEAKRPDAAPPKGSEPNPDTSTSPVLHNLVESLLDDAAPPILCGLHGTERNDLCTSCSLAQRATERLSAAPPSDAAPVACEDNSTDPVEYLCWYLRHAGKPDHWRHQDYHGVAEEYVAGILRRAHPEDAPGGPTVEQVAKILCRGYSHTLRGLRSEKKVEADLPCRRCLVWAEGVRDALNRLKGEK